MRGLAGMGTEHWLCVLVLAGLAASLWTMWRQREMQAAERWRERQLREELEAYARINSSLLDEGAEGTARVDPAESQRALARRVCRTIAEKSVFPRVAMLMRNAEGRLLCVGSVGVDDVTIAKLHGWSEKVMAEERQGGPPKSIRAGAASFSIPIGEWEDFDRELSDWVMSGKKERRKWRRAIVAPIRTGAGRLMGVLVVCADGARGKGRRRRNNVPGGLERAVGPIEGLTRKLARELENDVLRERLLRAEKLAGLGQLAGGVAHALNNPLTAVLGFGELIVETSSDPRVRKDAETIVQEALKMKETVEKLVEFWRPAPQADEAVQVVTIVQELAAACCGKLAERGVKLEVEAQDDVPAVRGSCDRLRQVMEHLLNNAAQAIAVARPREEGEEHAIRVTITHDRRALHLIVSDTGPGFREPARVFDPFYTTRGPEQGAGMGLSICYGVVREHGGEISAFNLHPHGAAVVVELPVGRVVSGEERLLVRPAGEKERRMVKDLVKAGRPGLLSGSQGLANTT